jgi:hypothetical protein
MRKGKDPEPDPYLWLMDPDPGGLKTCRSGSPTLFLGLLDPHLDPEFICTDPDTSINK